VAVAAIGQCRLATGRAVERAWQEKQNRETEQVAKIPVGFKGHAREQDLAD